MDSSAITQQQCLNTWKIGGWFDHPSCGILEIGGNDRAQFLHNVLTNDVKKLVPGTGNQACLLTAQAKIIAAVNVLCFDSVIWLAFDYALKKQLQKTLEKLIIMEQVALIDRSEELKLVSVHGPMAKELIRKISGGNSPDQMLNHQSIQIERIPVIIVKINLTGENGYGILFPKTETLKIFNLVNEQAAALEMTKITPPAMDIMRIAAGIPKYGIDYDESNIPLECLLDHTISFTKGCFPGQEVIARLDSRDGVSKKLCGIILKGEVAPKKDDPILENETVVGRITGSAYIPVLKKTVALGYLKKENCGIGRSVVVQTEKDQIPARVADLPFYSGNNG